MVLERKRVDRLDKAKTHVPGGGPAIVEARKKAGVSTAELSRLCTNISESMLSRYERGENEVKLCVLEEVARALKMKPIDLLKIAHSIYVDSLEKTYTSPYAREIIAQFRPRD
jgi:transcriptional regulator with XRE-family HTH domain